jgi:hypothetical protein
MTPQRLSGALSVFLAILFFAPRLHAQTPGSVEAPVDRLRREIATLKKTGCGPATSALVRDEFGKLIETRQTQLSLLLEQQIAEVEAAPQSAGIVLTAEDKRTIAEVIAPLQAEREALQSGGSVCDTSKDNGRPAVRGSNSAENQRPLETVAAVSIPAAATAGGNSSAMPAADPPAAQPSAAANSVANASLADSDPPAPPPAAAQKAAGPPAAQAPCAGANLPYLWKKPVVGTRVLTGCAKQSGDEMDVAVGTGAAPQCKDATYKGTQVPTDTGALTFAITLGDPLAKGEWVCIEEIDYSKKPPGLTYDPQVGVGQPVELWTYDEASTPWGRVRPYLSGGTVLSQNNGQFSSQSLFVGFNLDKNWFARDSTGKLGSLVNTYFDARLTSIPTASCEAAGSGSSGCSSSGSGGASANLSNFITSQKAAVIEGGIYVPLYLDSRKWSWGGNDNVLFVAPIFKGGYQSLTEGAQTVTSPTPGTSTTISTVNNQTLYFFYAGGVRLGHYELFNSWNIAPDLLSHLDIVFGKWQNFAQCSSGSCSGTSTTVLPTMIELEGRLKIPATFFQIGFDAISPLTKTSGTKGDLRFLFGVQLDPSCLFNAFQGTSSTLTSCVQGHSNSTK